MDPVAALTAAGAAARRAVLRRTRVSDRALAAAVAAGTVVQAGRGTFALPGTHPDLALAVRLGGVASHAMAAELHELATWTSAKHVTVSAGSRRTAPGVTVHRYDLSSHDVERGRPVTSPLRTLLDCGRALSLVEAVVVLDCALRRGVVDLATLEAAAEAARGHGSAALRRAVAHVDARSESALESVLRLLLWQTSARVVLQVRMNGLGRVDFVLDGWLVVEADGFAFHADRDSYRRDRRRANLLAVRGLVLLRFSYEDVRFRPDVVLEQVEALLASRSETIGVATGEVLAGPG
ncbi:MAG: DUF559 domain-containing protein [Sporichthyaceae bacterium]